MAHGTKKQPSFIGVFEGETDLKKYSHNALSLFALSLYLRLDDISDFAASAITEGPDDKKVDICYLDLNEGRAIVAQSYVAKTWCKKSAPANKASDLNTAMTWLLSVTQEDIPTQLKTKATEMRSAITNGELKRLEILFIHNCYESDNVKAELKAAAEAARAKAQSLIASEEPPEISFQELGIEAIEDLYKSRDSEILVDEWLDIPSPAITLETGGNWRAILATVPGSWVRELHRKHGDRLFSANYRDYLGSSSRRGNINRQIAQTAQTEPSNFWVYNNGITALTHQIRDDKNPVQIKGVSVINGAQTTGALSEAVIDGTGDTKVMIRFVECATRELIDKIILYNNTQNEIKPADRRSSDQIQRALHDEFAKYDVSYVHRRNQTRTRRDAITAAAIAPALCAFHGEPQIALRRAKDIFNEDAIYDRVFPQNISAAHIFLVKSLSRAIDAIKSELNMKDAGQSATQLERRQYEVLKYSASKHFVFFIVGFVAEEIMGKRVCNLFQWRCRLKAITTDGTLIHDAWSDALRALLPFAATIVEQKEGSDPFYDVPRSLEQSKQVARKLKALVASVAPTLQTQFESIRGLCTV